MLPTRTQQTFTNSRTRLVQGKESSFQISIFLSPAVLSFYCFLLARLFQLLQASLAPSLSQSDLPKLRKKATNNSKGWPPMWRCKNQRAHGPARGSSPVLRCLGPIKAPRAGVKGRVVWASRFRGPGMATKECWGAPLHQLVQNPETGDATGSCSLAGRSYYYFFYFFFFLRVARKVR